MIAFVEGTVAAKEPDAAVIAVGGIGYRVAMSGRSLARLPEKDTQSTRVLTYLQVREDAMTLYGFTSTAEKALFERLISISGVGPKVALSALTRYSPQELTDAIMNKDVRAITDISGVGKKMATRIIVELEGSLQSDDTEAASTSFSAATLSGVKEALLSMGFTSTEIELSLKDAPQDAAEAVLLQYALKRLGE